MRSVDKVPTARNERRTAPNRRLPAAFLLAALAGLALVASGCSAFRFPGQEHLVASYRPDNVHIAEPSIPPEIRRVALLPLAEPDDTESAQLGFGRQTLFPILADEIGRSRRFEVIQVPAEQLRRITGLTRWNPAGRLPENFFERLRDDLGADAVILAELTQYRPHEPLSIGWRLRLVETADPRVLWAIDEVFDARIPSVAAAARRHARSHPDTPGSLADDQAVLQSPRRFGRYAAAAVMETLPPRASARAELKTFSAGADEQSVK
jgi:hypothetical protein